MATLEDFSKFLLCLKHKVSLFTFTNRTQTFQKQIDYELFMTIKGEQLNLDIYCQLLRKKMKLRLLNQIRRGCAVKQDVY